jgi:anti-sigma B factor antagonist/stage II sporulation protein AA (anti-sigma F factor antagonist)
MSERPAETAPIVVTESGEDGTTRHVVTGEIDMDTAGALTASLDASLDPARGERPAALTVDLAGVTFLDSSGLAALVRAHVRAGELGIPMTVVNSSAIARRVLEMTGVWEMLTGTPSSLG